MSQSVLDGLCSTRNDVVGVALLGPDGHSLASSGSRAHDARKAAEEAMCMLESGQRMTLEAERGWAVAERFQTGELLLVLTEASPNLGGLLAEVRRCCERLAR